ncbi:MAG: MOSC domain-containing protein [Candidatus Omnitrophota bacterium]
MKNSEIRKGKVNAISISEKKGTGKTNVESAVLKEDFGIVGDAHGGAGLRQVSLLAIESIKKQVGCSKAGKDGMPLGPGDFAENITTEGIKVAGLMIGDRLNIGGRAILEITKIGKECHKFCAIYEKTGDCIMPREGIFARVVKGGTIVKGEGIEVIDYE